MLPTTSKHTAVVRWLSFAGAIILAGCSSNPVVTVSVCDKTLPDIESLELIVSRPEGFSNPPPVGRLEDVDGLAPEEWVLPISPNAAGAFPAQSTYTLEGTLGSERVSARGRVTGDVLVSDVLIAQTGPTLTLCRETDVADGGVPPIDASLCTTPACTCSLSPWGSTQVLSDDGGREPAMFVDDTLALHIAFYDLAQDSLIYLFWDGINLPTISTKVVGGSRFPSIFVDSNEETHIAHGKFSDRDLLYWDSASGQGQNLTPGPTNFGGVAPAIFVDSTQQIHIVHHDNGANTTLQYTSGAFSNVNWTTELLEQTGQLWVNSSDMIADGAEGLHTFYSFEDGEVRHGYLPTGQTDWNVETLEGAGGDDIGAGIAAAVDTNDHLHVVYENATSSTIRYAHGTFGAWEFEEADLPHNIQRTRGFARSPNGTLHVAYQASGTDSLWVAERSPVGIWTTTRVAMDSAANVDSIAVDSSGNVHLLYHDYSTSQLLYRRRACI